LEDRHSSQITQRQKSNALKNSSSFIDPTFDRNFSQIDLNGSVRIPVGGGSGNSTNYLVGASWNF
jgi:hypothetical protein